MPAFALALLLFQSITPTFTDVAYGAKPLEKMDVYLAPSTSPTPVLIEIHPGGWASGAKSQFNVYGGSIEKIYSRGISVISIGYPLAPADLYPQQNLSCLRAVQFVRANAQNWNIDPNNIAAMGMSAGAHLSMWVAMSPDAAIPGSPDPVLQQSSRLRAVVSVRGPSWFTAPYYKHNPAISGHGSPVWTYFGVSNQAQWDAIPNSTKLAVSPAWLASQSAMLQNKNVSVLCLHDGDPLVTNSSQLPLPETNVHNLVYGILFREALQAIGNKDVEVWAGASIENLQGAFYPGDMIADWLDMRLRSSKLSNFGFASPGCYGSLFLLSNGEPFPGNPAFKLKSYLNLSNTLAAIIFDDHINSGYSDPFALGLRLWHDYNSPTMFELDAMVNPAGMLDLDIAVPNDPLLSGQTFYAQAITSWNGPGMPVGCVTTPLKLSTTNTLKMIIP